MKDNYKDKSFGFHAEHSAGCETLTDTKNVIIDFVSKTELTEDGLREHWYTEMNGKFVSNSISYDKDTARKFHDTLIENGGKIVNVKILNTTEVEDKR